MIENIVLLPEAVADAAEAYQWYEQRGEGLGDRFLKCVGDCIERIQQQPELAERVYLDFRRILVRRFPYVIFYEFEADRIVIYSIFHSSQDPRKWRERLVR